MTSVPYSIIPCAGLGKRMQPLSLFMPKEMVPVGKFPILHYSIRESALIGCREIILIISEGKEVIRPQINICAIDIQLIRQPGRQLVTKRQGPQPNE